MEDKFAKALFAEKDEVSERNIYFDFVSEDTSCLFKKAYVTSMPKPTVEKIKKHVAERIKSDLGNKNAEVNVSISVSDVEGDNVKNGKGTASVSVGGKKFSVPFTIANGEISNLAEMNVGDEKLAYNKQSMAAATKPTKKEQETSSFIGTAKYSNPSTDRGFLDEAISIRDQHMSRQTNSVRSGRYVTASEACDEMLKTAFEIKEIEDNTYLAVENIVREKIASTVVGRIEKTASEEVDKKLSHAEQVFTRIQNLPLKSVHSMKNGQKILFPERNASELSMTPGVVFKDIDADYHTSAMEIMPGYKFPATTIVVANDGRMVALGSSTEFLALEDDSAAFKLPATSMKTVAPNNIYMAVRGDKAIAPFKVRTREGGSHTEAEVVEKLSQLIGVEKPIIHMGVIETEDRLHSAAQVIGILMPGGRFRYDAKKVNLGGHKYDVGVAKEMLTQLMKDDLNLKYSVSSLFEIDRAVAIDPDMKVIKISGEIQGYVGRKEELKPSYKALNPSELIKTASADKIHVKLVDAENKIWSAKTIGKNKKDLGNKINKKELNTLLLAMGYNTSDIADIITTTRNVGEIYKELPLNTEMNRLFDGEVNSSTKSLMSKIKDKAFNKEKAKEALQGFGLTVVTSMLGDVAADSESLYSGLDAISKLAETSQAATTLFEKLAMEHRSEDLQDVAKIMLTGNKLANTVLTAYNKGYDFSMVKEACEAIIAHKGAIEKTASGLVGLSNDQFARGDEYVPYEGIGTALEVMGDTFVLAKIASNNNQDIICVECGAKATEPLQNGKCNKCVQEALDMENEENKKEKKQEVNSEENKIQADEDK